MKIMDHVSAFRQTNSRQNQRNNSFEHKFTRNKPLTIPINLTHLKVMKPIPCEQFRIDHIIKSLKKHFISCWSYEKYNSPKLALFYNKIKHTFEKEIYLDLVTNCSFKYKTTQLRISAHELEIERGRYKKIPRDKRICKWCENTLKSTRMEDEDHFLFHCELYAPLRTKLIKTITKCPDLVIHAPVTTNNLEKIIFNIQHSSDSSTSSRSISNLTNSSSSHTNSIQTLTQKGSSHLVNAIATFIGNSFKRRSQYIKDLSVQS